MSATSISRPTDRAEGAAVLVRRHRTPLWRVVGIIGAVAMGLAGAGALLAHSPLFHVRAVRIDGASHLIRERVVRLGGLRDGANLLWLELDEIERRLESHAWVANATVERDLPSTLTIALVERRPVAAVSLGGSYRLVAGDGAILGVRGSATGLTRIEEVWPAPFDRAAQEAGARAVGSTDDWRPTSTGPASADAVAPAAASLAAMQPWVRERIARVVVDADRALWLETTDGALVAYGDAAQTDAKARALASLLLWAEGEGEAIVSADVRSPVAPTADLESGASTLG